MRRNSGFTLIELLVVIAIIGILAAVVLASLGSARTKGADASIKAQLHDAHTQAEVYATVNNTYVGVCAATQASNGFASILSNAISITGASLQATNAAQLSGRAVCDESGTTWVISIPLTNASSNGYWCVDSSGNSKAQPYVSNLVASATHC